MICLDTSVLIEYFRSKEKQTTLFTKLSKTNLLSVTSITTYEIYRGALARIPFWEMVFQEMEILNFDEDASKVAAGIYLELKSKNKLIASADIYIAAIALLHNATLATHNIKDFSRIDGLRLYGQ
jgi:tRNA(fMet)-specific endonuclease VapC